VVLVAGIGEEALDEREQGAGAPIENQSCPVAVLNVGGMDDDVQQKAERVELDARKGITTAEPFFERPSRSGCQ
jgi:hypothetical protein